MEALLGPELADLSLDPENEADHQRAPFCLMGSLRFQRSKKSAGKTHCDL
jgi:hypothetical protein